MECSYERKADGHPSDLATQHSWVTFAGVAVVGKVGRGRSGVSQHRTLFPGVLISSRADADGKVCVEKEGLNTEEKSVTCWCTFPERMEGDGIQAGRRVTSSVGTEDRPVTDLVRISTLSWSPEQFPGNCQELLNSYKSQTKFSSLTT